MTEANGEFTTPPASDPLIPRDFNDWMLNAYGIGKRSGGRILGVLLLWSVIPTIAAVWQTAQMVATTERLNRLMPTGGQPMSREQSEMFWTAMGQLATDAGLMFAVSLVLSYFTAAGWSAALRIALTDAAGQPIGFGRAMAYGARRGLAMWGWYVLVTVVVLIGACLCVLPGLYLSVAFAVFAPVVVCEGGMALARSFRLVHNSFGRMLGRIALSFATVFAISLIFYVVQSMLAGAGLGSNGRSAGTPLDWTVDGLFSLASGVITAVILVSALLVTYAQARAAEDPSVDSTAELLRRSPA